MKVGSLIGLGLALWVFTACSPQNLFQSKVSRPVPDSLMVRYADAFEHRIRPDDKLTISIWNHDDLSVGSTFGIYNSNEVYGKWLLVDSKGMIAVPALGVLQVAGFTTSALKDTLTKLYSKQIVDPVVVVKVLNRQVTVLGEVIHPATHTLEKEKNGVVEMIGRSGGFDTYADKKHVTIIRQVGTQTVKIEMDLTDLADYELHNFVLESNDIIYIPTRTSKLMDKRATTIIPFAGMITAVVVLISFISKQ